MAVAALATKQTRIYNYQFQEGVLSPPIFIPDDAPIACHYFNIQGTITVTTPGTTSPQNNLWPVLCNLLGYLTFNGKPRQNVGTGKQYNGVPFFALWYKNFYENSVAPQNVGTALTGNLTATTYNVNFTIPVQEFDPKWSTDGQEVGIYRGSRYGRPNWSIQAGRFAPPNLGNPDLQSYIATAATPVYTYNLTVTYSVDYVTNVAMNLNDACLDNSVEYNPILSFGAAVQNTNLIPVNLNAFQGNYILLNTSLDSNGIETGIDNLAVGNGGLMDTKFGGTIYDQMQTSDVKQSAQQKYLSGGLSVQTGVYFIDQIGRSTQGMKASKTFLGTSGQPYLDLYAGPVPGDAETQSVRMIHFASNLSKSFEAILAPFGPWGGV